MTSASEPSGNDRLLGVDREQLQQSIENMLDGFSTFRCVRDASAIVDFEWLYVNPAGAATYGCTPDELIGRRMTDVLPGIETTIAFDAYRAVVDTDQPMSMVQQTSEHVAGIFDLRAWKLSDGFAVTWQDVSARENALDALRESEERFRGSVEHLHEALSVFVAVRASDGEIIDFRWMYANPAASVITGYTSRELEGRLLLDVLPAHGPSGMLQVYKDVVDAGQPYIEPSLWYEDVWGDGRRRRRAFDVRATKLHDGFAVVTREVTEEREHQELVANQRAELERSYNQMLAANERAHEKAESERQRLEAQLHQSQRLESLGHLAGGIAHDFNNLLAAIINYGTFVAEELDSAISTGGDDRWRPVREDMEQIQRAAQRATELTRQLLAFGRREVVRPRVLDLNAVVSDVEQLLRRTIGEHVQLATSLEPGVRTVTADPGQIEQVLLNLAVNARDAMPDGGSLTIDTSNIDVDHDMASARPGLDTGRHVRLRVSDTGNGMDPATKARAFEPFFTTKEKGKGSGLGLATVYGIVAQAGGYAQIYSEPGLGFTFTALFPAHHSEEPDPVAATTPIVVGDEIILLVEDDDAMRDVTQRMLSRNGYTVIPTPSGAGAIEVARHQPIRLLLTDVVMPQLLGREVAELVLREQPGVRVLFMSGYARPVLASQGTLDPGIHLLEKPFSEALLLAKVREVLDEP